MLSAVVVELVTWLHQMTKMLLKASVYAVHTATRNRRFPIYPLWRAFSKNAVSVWLEGQNGEKKTGFQTKTYQCGRLRSMIVVPNHFCFTSAVSVQRWSSLRSWEQLLLSHVCRSGLHDFIHLWPWKWCERLSPVTWMGQWIHLQQSVYEKTDVALIADLSSSCEHKPESVCYVCLICYGQAASWGLYWIIFALGWDNEHIWPC